MPTDYEKSTGRFRFVAGDGTSNSDELSGRIYTDSLEVGTTGKAIVDYTGHLFLRGTATVWEDSMVPAVAFRSGLTALTFDAITTNLYGYRMDVNDVAHLMVQMPHSMKMNTILKPHLHIVNKTGIASNATEYNTKWNFTYVWANINSSFGTEASSVAKTIDHRGNAALKHQLVSFDDITPSATQGGISSILIMAVGRVAADSAGYAGTDIYTLGLDIHFERDTLGSQDVTSKTDPT